MGNECHGVLKTEHLVDHSAHQIAAAIRTADPFGNALSQETQKPAEQNRSCFRYSGIASDLRTSGAIPQVKAGTDKAGVPRNGPVLTLETVRDRLVPIGLSRKIDA